MDIAARRQAASAEAMKIRATVAEPRSQLRRLEEELVRLKRKTEDREQTATLRDQVRAQERIIREIEARAQEVEDAAFDLKAVNPNSSPNEDTRSSAEILAAIEQRGRDVAAALQRLRGLVVMS